ncbi:Glycosyl hydrolase family 26 [Mycetocola miduiensis]|uniref:Glycosyl hydrolase family 26 n=1 Tax=Mycetocola miduiensis TaxID=995034 RepID=A0A1I5CRN0_9MICO|nr:Glycosyl hydrolase family 26 [Mycetocola miduiensis]
MLFTRALRAVPVVALAFALGGCSGPTSLPPCEALTLDELAPGHGVLFGVNPDWANQSLLEFGQAIGEEPAVAVSFVDFPLREMDVKNLTAAVHQVQRAGGTLLLTLEPKGGLDTVTTESVDDLADVLAPVEATGTTVVVRFGHEMNGSWYAWGQQPEAYIHAFRTVSSGLRDSLDATSMMWAPNYAGGYPFAGGAFEAKRGTAHFAALDTNGDGTVGMTDDPYAPYYPGDDAVDWVGMSLYHWGSAHPWGENELPEDGKFVAQLTGQYRGLAGDDSAVPDFYAEYGEKRQKLVAIPETAALVVNRGDAAGELAIKQAWWWQIFAADIPERFPKLKMINWFEWHKFEPEVRGDVDWTITSDRTVTRAFAADLPEWVRFAEQRASCTPG